MSHIFLPLRLMCLFVAVPESTEQRERERGIESWLYKIYNSLLLNGDLLSSPSTTQNIYVEYCNNEKRTVDFRVRSFVFQYYL